MTTQQVTRNEQGLIAALVNDGRPLLKFTGLMLVLSGVFALFLSCTKHFLPHDVDFLGMTPAQLCAINECRIVHFMIHDRVSFGGTLIAIGVLYLWLCEFPLRRGEEWAWWLFVVSGLWGFGSFLLYLGYGYLDTWHGSATLVLLPMFLAGMIKTRRLVTPEKGLASLFSPCEPLSWRSSAAIGRALLIMTSLSLCLGGLIISFVGITTVLVPQDLAFMNITVDELNRINPRLLPLIAHDRAGFGGGVCCVGLTMFFCLWRNKLSKDLWQAVAIAGTSGFATAVLIHPAIGYTDLTHLAPAYLGALMFTVGIIMTGKQTSRPQSPS